MAGDIEKAKRDLRSAKFAADDGRWDAFEEKVESILGALEGLSDAEKDPVLAELAPLRKQGEDALRTEKARAIEDSITRNIDDADPRRNAPDRVASQLKRALEMLDGEEAKKWLDAAVAEKLRARIDSMRGDSAGQEKKKRLDAITSRMSELEERMASQPFEGADEYGAGRIREDLDALVVAIRNNLNDLAADDADGQTLREKLERLEGEIEAAAADWEKAGAVGKIVESWRDTQNAFAGWEEEQQSPTWDEFMQPGTEGMSDLLMPMTVEAIRRCSQWLEDGMLEEDKTKYQDDATVQATIAEATGTLDAAAAKLHEAFSRVMDEGEQLPTPDMKRELEKPEQLIRGAERWFAKTRYAEEDTARARRLREKWEAAIEILDREGLELYRKLEAEASAAWPAIEKSVKAAAGFDPSQPEKWKNKTIKLAGIRNRSGWDFKRDYDFALTRDGIHVAGNYEEHIAKALREAANRTRHDIDDHTDWDVIAVVEGTGTIQERVNREVKVWVKDRTEDVRTETWEPRNCVTVRIIGLRAGPVAVGPR